REAVTSQRDARIIVLEVRAIEGSGLSMLGFLQRWDYDHDIRLKLFNPSKSVQNRLEHASSVTGITRERNGRTLRELQPQGRIPSSNATNARPEMQEEQCHHVFSG